MLKDFNDVIGALKEDFAESMESVSTGKVEDVKTKIVELDSIAESVKPIKVDNTSTTGEVVVEKTGSLLLSFLLQIVGVGVILVILATFTFNSLISNLDILTETYKSTMYFDGYSLIMCDSLESFVNNAIESVASYDYTGIYVKMGVDFVICVFGLYITYKASKTSNTVALVFQRVILGLSILTAIGIQGYALSDNFAFMPNVSINNYLNTLSNDKLQDLALELNGVTIQLRSDGTAHGVYRANKENMLNTLINSTSNWGVDFELPKHLVILDAEFELSGVTETEFIYELPEVMYVKDYDEAILNTQIAEEPTVVYVK